MYLDDCVRRDGVTGCRVGMIGPGASDRETLGGNFRAAANISSARARTRMSSVKLVHCTIFDESTRNSAGRAMSCPSGPPAVVQDAIAANYR